MKKIKTFILAGVLASLIPLAARSQHPPVVLTSNDETATLDNGIVSITVRKANANLLSLKYKGLELLSRGGGYWNIYGQIPGEAKTEKKGVPSEYIITQDPRQNGGELGEITLRFPYLGQDDTVPLDIEIRYSLLRGDPGVYGWTIAEHMPGYPAFYDEVNTVCLKLNPDIFDFTSVDAKRQKQMPTAEDWVHGTQLNLWEARRMNTGIHAGKVEHKYDYNALFSETPAFGWSSTKHNVGLYVVNPSIEYINGGPVGLDYGVHIDVKASLPADPTLLFIWHTSHYGGRGIQIYPHEHWRKIVGPFLLFCTEGPTPVEMWNTAMTRADQEQRAWPYEWADAPGYEHATERGSVKGRLVVTDPQHLQATAAGAWVGLAHEPYEVDLRTPMTIDWQTDGKHYQYWARADASGAFEIQHVRPGNYVLYAFNDGILGEFNLPNVMVGADKTVHLGAQSWIPKRNGRQIWEIGVPNRSAEEFRHGDHFWQWGLYNLYPDEFPNDVNFVIGQSNWSTDWNYVQPPTPDGNESWKNTTWAIRFNMDQTVEGMATLNLAICGARGGPVDISLNGKPIGSTGPLAESGVMHRDGIRSSSLERRDIRFDASLFRPGENVIELTKQVRDWTDGVLYDYIRLELNQEESALW